MLPAAAATPAPRALRRWLRRLGGRLRPHAAAVVYHPRYASALAGLPVDALRAERILAFLAAEGLAVRGRVHAPQAASLKSLERVHAGDYLESLHAPSVLARIFATDISSDQVDRLIDHQRLTSGGTKLASRLVLGGKRMAINLAGGQHHAHAEHGEALCILNDVAIAIADARARGFSGRVLIIDLDLHDGNGTRAIFARDARVHTFSIHARHWGPTEAIASTSIELGEAVDDRRYLDVLHQALPEALRQAAPELVFYLAGTDPAADDRLGNWQISAQAMLARDRLVLKLVRQRRAGRRHVPLVITLAGGYGTASWRYSARFLALAMHGRALEPPSTEAMTLARFRHLARLEEPFVLSAGPRDDFGLTEEDVFLPRWGVVRETRLLGYYSKHGLELVLERAGLLERLRDLGYSHPTLEIDLEHPAGHAVRIWGSPERQQLLVEVHLARDLRTISGLRLLAIAWLHLQNPRARFPPGRRPLPGQEHPGLGMLHEAVALCAVACERLHLDGVVWTPAHFHTAGAWQQVAVATDPAAGARLRALASLLRGVALDTASEAVERGAIADRDGGEPLRWQPVPMVLPLSPAARTWAAAQERAIDAQPAPHLVWNSAAGC